MDGCLLFFSSLFCRLMVEGCKEKRQALLSNQKPITGMAQLNYTKHNQYLPQVLIACMCTYHEALGDIHSRVFNQPVPVNIQYN